MHISFGNFVLNKPRGRVETWTDNWSFAEVVTSVVGKERWMEEKGSSFWFKYKEEDKERLNKSYIGKFIVLGSAYNIQTQFNMEVFYAIKVTPMGGNICLLEEVKEGSIEDLIGEGEKW